MKAKFLVLFLLSISPILLIGQAKKYMLFEHFTQASCGPCASQNPAFQSVYDENVKNAHHVAYHTAWPGSDPMNAHNKTEVADMVDLYGVTGVPAMVADGRDIGGPASVSQDMIDVVTSSPIRINVALTGDDVTKTAIVNVETISTVESSSYVIRVAVVERLIEYSSPPGSNGEKDFPNVFRKFITEDVKGDAITMAEVGESLTLSFNFDMHAIWQTDEIYILAYIQNTADKSVLNSGSSDDPKSSVFNSSDHSVVDADDELVSFQAELFMQEEGAVVIESVFNGPADWTTSLNVDEVAISGSDPITLAAGNHTLSIDVQAGAIAGLGSAVISVRDEENSTGQRVLNTVINGVNELVLVANKSGDIDIEAPYVNSLEAAEINTFGSMEAISLPLAYRANALKDVKEIYYSIGWVFPALSDELTEVLIDFLDNGGSLLIAGQDIGWDVMSGSSNAHGTALQKTFYTDYLKVDYKDDGSPSRNKYNSVEETAFADVQNSNISAVYGSNYLYPDAVDPLDETGKAIFKYNDNANGGVMVGTDTYKVVYLGVGLEMLSDETNNDIIKTTSDWFKGLISSDDVQFTIDNEVDCYPNPASEILSFDFDLSGLESPSLQIVDVLGNVKKVLDLDLQKRNISIDVSGFESGIYFYNIIDGGLMSAPKTLSIK